MLRLIFRPLEKIKRPWWKIRWFGGCGRLKPHLPDVEKGYAKNKLQLYPRLAYVCSEHHRRRCARSSTGRGSTSRLQLINCNRPALIVASCTLSVPLIGCVSNSETLSAVRGKYTAHAVAAWSPAAAAGRMAASIACKHSKHRGCALIVISLNVHK